MPTEVYGASDDLVEFDGDVYGEFGCYDSSPLIVFSDGTVMVMRYGDSGIWKADVFSEGKLFDRVDVCTDPDAKRYSDTVHFRDGLKWAYATSEFEKVK